MKNKVSQPREGRQRANEEIAVLVPCYNEAVTIAKVVRDFKRELPKARVYVYDNNSTDGTDEIARRSGAVVRYEYAQGKGNVMRRMFSEINADIYILADGDDTYPAEAAREMIALIREGKADMVTGDRLSNGAYTSENKRRFHNFGNNLVKRAVNTIFRAQVNDIMSGYRAFNKLFVKNFPVMSKGFEIETEMTIHALDRGFMIKEVPIDYRDRPEGSVSKLNTFSDGFKVIRTIVKIFKHYRPLAFFRICAFFTFIAGIACGAPVLYEFFKTEFITHVPLAILASAVVLLAMLMLICGIILDTVVSADKRRYELRLIDFRSKQ